MQNEPKLKMTQMFVTKALTSDYNSWTLGFRGKKQSQFKANQTQFALKEEPLEN